MGHDTTAPSGRFVLRIDPAVHGRLRRNASGAGVSLNAYCARLLSGASSKSSGVPSLDRVVDRADRLYGPKLLGVAVFGSWARGTSTASSDIDVLIVLDGSLRLRRKLYRSWDSEPMQQDGRQIEVHLVHLPPEDRVVLGLWGEVAVDGIVIHERELALSSRLVAIRHDIVAGRIARTSTHGHTYWVRSVA